MCCRTIARLPLEAHAGTQNEITASRKLRPAGRPPTGICARHPSADPAAIRFSVGQALWDVANRYSCVRTPFFAELRCCCCCVVVVVLAFLSIPPRRECVHDRAQILIHTATTGTSTYDSRFMRRGKATVASRRYDICTWYAFEY